MAESESYAVGDWIVHSHYGLGKIQGHDVKDISGEETRYLRVEASKSTYWIPVDQMDSEVIRKLSTPEEIEDAIATLQRPPRAMSSNFKTRQTRIKRTRVRNTPKALARLIRDLRERQRDKGPLNATERNAFRTFRQRLVEEWAVVAGLKTERVESRLEILLDPDREMEEGQGNGENVQETAAKTASVEKTNEKGWATWPRTQTNKINR